MSYGDETPMTSSDDDNVISPHETLGGFTETNLDAQQNTPHSDDNEDEMMEDDTNNNNFVKIHFEGAHTKFNILYSYETLSDLRHKINLREDMQMSSSHYFLLPRNIDNNYYDDEDEDELIESGRLLIDENEKLIDNYNNKTLSIYWKSFNLTIFDGIDLTLNIRVSCDWTIRKLKDYIETNHNVRLQCLSHLGMELIDDQQLQEHDINKSGFTLISRISITIEDMSCDLSTDLLICDFWDFDKVLTTYLDAERREFHKNASFYYLGNRIELSEHVYNNNLSNRSKLEYKVEKYPVEIYDSEIKNNDDDLNAETLNVFDYWTLNDVKKLYSKLTKKPFMEKEKFLSQERELEDDIPLWKLRIRDNEKLIIQREQQQIVVSYICCECGAKVNLRRYDSVQCRQCFHGAVFKQRTGRVCQYSCR